MNYDIFHQKAKGCSSPNSFTPSYVANVYANAYNSACINSCSTKFQAMLLSGGVDKLEKRMKESLDYASKFKTDKKITWDIMSTGFVEYWKESKFTMFPPNPPSSGPNPQSENPGVKVNMIFGFDPELSKQLQKAWKKTDFDIFLNYFYDSLLSFHSRIFGVYNGLVTTPTPTPVSIPWFGIIGGLRSTERKLNTSLLVKPVPQGRGTYIPIIQKWENEARLITDKERGIQVHYPKYDKIEFSTQGTEGEVEIGSAERFAARINQNAIRIHNHPKEEVSYKGEIALYTAGPSHNDIIGCIDDNLAEERVVNWKYTYVIQRPEGGWGEYRSPIEGMENPDGTYNPEAIGINRIAERDIRNDFDYYSSEKYDKDVEKTLLRLNKKSKDDIPFQTRMDLIADAVHYANVMLAKKYEWKYERIKTADLKNQGIADKPDGYYGP